MFGANFFKKNESPRTQTPKKRQEGISVSQKDAPAEFFEQIEDHENNDLLEFTQIELAQQKILFLKFSISQPQSIFHIENLSSKAEDFKEVDAMPQVKDELIKEGLEQESEGLNEILPLSETDLVAQIVTEYSESAFAQKAHEAFMRRGVTQEQLPKALEHLFTKMAQKNIEAFKGDVTQILYESNFNEFDAENYIYWRFNEYTENNPMHLITNGNTEALVADNFLTEELITLFYTQQENIDGEIEELKESSIVTSEKIDELLSEIENV